MVWRVMRSAIHLKTRSSLDDWGDCGSARDCREHDPKDVTDAWPSFHLNKSRKYLVGLSIVNKPGRLRPHPERTIDNAPFGFIEEEGVMNDAGSTLDVLGTVSWKCTPGCLSPNVT